MNTTRTNWTEKDILGALFGFGLFGIGVAALILGVWGLYSRNPIIGAFLIFGGQTAAILGARFASMPAQPKRQMPLIGNYLYGLSFVVSISLLVLALATVFSTPLPSIYLMIVAFLGTAVAAWSVVRRSQPG